jgi:hypothetical protein
MNKQVHSTNSYTSTISPILNFAAPSPGLLGFSVYCTYNLGNLSQAPKVGQSRDEPEERSSPSRPNLGCA